jgi:DNA polymerase
VKRLYSSLILQKLYRLKEFGYQYTDIDILDLDEACELPNELEPLKEIVSNCHLCQLSKSRNNIVFGEGNEEADLMFVGEGPGATEDSTGRPFVGNAGNLLTSMIEKAILIPRKECYIANIVKCRPPKNRVPTQTEAISCIPYLKRQIEIIRPKIIVTLGGTAYRYLTNDTTAISRVRGDIINGDGYKIVPTFHPSYLLRNPSVKRLAYEDMLKIKELLSKL